jgi:hypothetical protein
MVTVYENCRTGSSSPPYEGYWHRIKRFTLNQGMSASSLSLGEYRLLVSSWRRFPIGADFPVPSMRFLFGNFPTLPSLVAITAFAADDGVAQSYATFPSSLSVTVNGGCRLHSSPIQLQATS